MRRWAVMRAAALSPLFSCFLAAALGLAACTPLSLVSTGINVVSALAGHAEDANVKQISELEAKQDWPGILKVALGNIQRDPSNHDWWLIAGYAHSRLGEHAQAIPCYQTAIRLRPDDVYSWNLLAQSYRSTNEPERAIRTLEQVLLIKSDSAVSFFLLGESYRDINLYERAIPNYISAAGIAPAMGEAWYGLGISYARIGRRNELPLILERLRKVDPPRAAQLEQMTAPR
jgi:tetratricopeptide (TPR) repeat protein